MTLSLNDGEFRMLAKDLILPESIKKEFELIGRIQFVHQGLFINHIEFCKSYHQSRLTEIKFSGGRVIYSNNEPLIDARRDMVRTMTNVIFSAKILIEHTRNTMKKYTKLGHKDISDYNEMLVEKNFLNDPLSNFMEILRNHVTHVGLIPITVEKDFYWFPYFYPNYVYNFDKNTLMEWEGLQVGQLGSKDISKAKIGERRKKLCAIQYLESSENQIEISMALKMYIEKLNDHQNSILNMISDKFSDK